jgi:hypothetical protein
MKNLILCPAIVFLLLVIPRISKAEKYEVMIKRVESNLYKDVTTGTLIKTSLCLELAIMDDAILVWDCALNTRSFGCGKLVFINSGESCQVDAVYSN